MRIILLFVTILFFACQPASDDKSAVQHQDEPLNVDTTETNVSTSDDDDERRRWQKPELVLNQLGDLSDKVIADLGAGIGYFVFKLLPNAKKVIAIDVDREKIDILNSFRSSLEDERKNKLEIRHSPPDNSLLKEKEADIILIVNTVAYLNQRVQYFNHLKNALTDNGKIVIVDFKTKIIPDFVNAPPYSQREYLHILEEELLLSGFTIEKTDDTSLDYQFMIIAQK